MEKGAVEWKKVQLNKKTCPTHTAGGQAIHSLETDSDYRPQQSTIMAVITIAQQASNAQSRKTIAIRDRFQLMVRPADWADWQVPPNTIRAKCPPVTCEIPPRDTEQGIQDAKPLRTRPILPNKHAVDIDSAEF